MTADVRRYTQGNSIAVLDRCGNNWKNGKGGCGPLLHFEYAPTLPTMFQPFVMTSTEKHNRNERCTKNR